MNTQALSRFEAPNLEPSLWAQGQCLTRAGPCLQVDQPAPSGGRSAAKYFNT